MNSTYTWLNGLVGQIVEGASDSFLISAGGSTVAQSLSASPGLTIKQILISMAIGAGLYAASFLKNNPTPFTTVTSVPGKDVTVPASESPPKVVPQPPTSPMISTEAPHV